MNGTTYKEGLTVGLPTSTFLPSLGGVEVGLHRIATGLIERGCNPVIFTASQHISRCQEIGWSLPYPVVPFPNKVFGILRRWPALGFLLLDRFFETQRQRWSIDVWHGTMGFPIGVALSHFASTKPNIPHLIRCCGEDIQIQQDIGYGLRLDPKIDNLVQTWLPKAQSMVAITESVADEYQAIGISDTNIARIPNGVDTERFQSGPNQEQVRSQHNIPIDSPMVLTVGRNHPKKNYRSLINIAVQVRKRERYCCFVVVGRDASALQTEISDAGVADMFRLLESFGEDNLAGQNLPSLPVQSLVDIYRAADVFLFPSLIETFGIVIVEAMAAGLPVITSDAPGCRDIIRHGRDGIMVDPLDVNKITSSLIDVLDSPRLSQELSDRSKARANDFDWNSVIDRYMEHYRSLIDAYPRCHD
ncbi:MAG: glycosyltransferase family 4 protein [Rhodospirillales bacterium]|nr:glycosyltransferase family 4 protein [Rhodospirillales bacterium]MBT4626119.1 glycosyltransferase family 4 protein [Rhodospirillales bacterium]MBT5522259.1 glycosyltransferase family 4 protein [Rhodospirillales bacterium]MBT6109378.1 glycosyltransferase family 4 protein [Rhodospirillales bacterium]